MTMEISERHAAQALDDVVEALMETGGWPARGSQLLLRDVLEDVDKFEWFESIVTASSCADQLMAVQCVRDELEKVLRQKLENHYTVLFLAADYQREAQADMCEMQGEH